MALVLGLSGGVALADRGHDSHRNGRVEHQSRNHSTYRDHSWRGDRGSWRGDRGHWRGNHVVVRDNHRGYRNWNRGGRVVRHDHYRHVVRRPIYLSRPVIRERYYNYYRRPSVIIENYNTMPGYYWVAGRWTWSGAEWIWQPGHYEPDPAYVDQGYSPGYYDSY